MIWPTERASAEQDDSNDRLARVGLWYLFKTLGIVIAGMAIFLGYRLFVLGVTGQASLSAERDKVKFQLLNAAPGLFFALGGLALAAWVIWAK